MRFLLWTLTAALVVAACTPKPMDNNKHDALPVYEQSPRIEPKKLKSLEQIEALHQSLRPAIKSEDPGRILSALEIIEGYTLNIENLTNPEMHNAGILHPSFTKLMNLYGMGLSIAVKKIPLKGRLEQLLLNYRNTIFQSCHSDNMDCLDAAAFKGPYGVTVLGFLIRNDIQKMKELGLAKHGKQAVKNMVFSLYVLKNFNERRSKSTEKLFIDFSSIFFRSLDIVNLEDALLEKYLVDLQNNMVVMSAQDAEPKTCAVFQELNREQLAHVTGNLNKEFVVQFNNHYYRCHTPEEIIARIIFDEEQAQRDEVRDVDNKGTWTEYKNNAHARIYTVEKELSPILNSLGANKSIPLSVLYVMDKIYYGRMEITEQEALLGRMTEEDLVHFVELADQYAKVNYFYNMHYTFNVFNKSIEERYAVHKTINKKFVQEVYDSLWQGTGDMWLDYRRRVNQLRQGLSDVYFKLSPKKRAELKATFDQLRDKKLEETNIVNLIDVGVSFPIVLATKYFSGVDGGGTMEIRVSWASGTSNSIEISTVNPLRDYFQVRSRDLLQLLDFGTIGYQPFRFERSYGFATAIRSGFFDAVNFDIGNDNQGFEHNLKLFWQRYIEHNQEYAEMGQRELEELRKVEENHWPKVTRICNSPITGERRIEMSELYQNFYLNSKEAGSSISTKDLSFATRINAIQTKVDLIYMDLDKIRRTYQVALKALEEGSISSEGLKKSFQKDLAPLFQTMRNLIQKRDKLLSDVQKENESCFYTVNLMERFQQNLMQKNAVEYAARVHAVMSMYKEQTSSNSDFDSSAKAEETKAYFGRILQDLYSSKAPDIYKIWVVEQLTQTSVLATVESQLGLNGNKLLAEAMNLIIAPHNMDADFGIAIRGLDIGAKSLDDPNSFLSRRGGFDGEDFGYFKISNQDQRFRVREELLNLTASAKEISNYIANSPVIEEELNTLGFDAQSNPEDDKEIPLNPNLTIVLKNFKHFKDNLSKTEKEHRVRFTSNRENFVRTFVEKLFGNNQEGQQIFNWSSQYSDIQYLGNNYSKNIDTYLHGPIFVPENMSSSSPDLTCYLERKFDDLSDIEGCKTFKLNAEQIIDEFIQRADFFYLDRSELAPLTLSPEMTDNSAPLSILAEKTLLSSDYIDQYKPTDILNYFKYYKKKTEPEEWTWFDQFLAKEFTTWRARDNSMQVVNVPIIPGVYQYEQLFEEMDYLEFEDLLVQFSEGTEEIFRNYYRSTIFNHISYTDSIIDEIVKREYTMSESEFPSVRFRREDVADLTATDEDAREWLDLPLKKRGNGSLVLLEDYGFEVKVFEDQQKVVLEEYECSLLPQPGDADFNIEADQYINQSTNCNARVRRWLNYKKCTQVKQRKSLFEDKDYHKSCVSDLQGE